MRKAGFCCTSRQRFRHVQTLECLTIIFLKQVAKKVRLVFVVSTTRQLGIVLLNVHFILPLEIICSPLLFACLLTVGLLCLKHNIIVSVFLFGSTLLSLDQNKFYFFLSSLLSLNRRDFIKVPKYVFSTCQHSLKLYPLSLFCCHFD